jgi:hypothetical protein
MSKYEEYKLENILRKAYQYFNNRDIDATLSLMHAEVDWPNGMEGGIEHGHDSVRNYWTRQWKTFDPHVEPVGIRAGKEGTVIVVVHQIVKDIGGKLILDQIIHHVYTFENGLIRAMEIQQPE